MNWLECKDEELVSNALTMWANWIQTGNPTLGSSDLHHFKKIKPKVLSHEQMELVLRLRGLASEVTR